MYNNILASLDCFLCCKKFNSKSGEGNPHSSLLHKKLSTGRDDQKYYTVRRVSRVAGTISLEDINDGKHGSDSSINNKIQINPKILLHGKNNKDDSGLWECPSQSSLMGDKSEKSSMEIIHSMSPPEKKQAKRWQKSYLQNQIRQRLNKSSPPCSLAASTPDLSTLSATVGSAKSSANASPQMSKNDIRRAGSLEVVNGTTWLKSQSMLDVAADSGGSGNSARDFGLDPALYPAPERGISGSQQDPEDARATLHGREDRFIEMSHGVVHFVAEFSSGKLHVHVSHLEDLPPKGEIRRYQVTLKLAVLPQDKHHVKTAKTPHDSKNPTFNEDFEFSLDNVAGHTLRISACDMTVHGKYDAVGHALFDLDQLVMQTRPKTFKLKLYKQSEPSNGNAGLLQASLTYEQREQRVTLLVLQCRGLQLAQTRGGRAPDRYTTFIKATLYCKGHKVKSKKSPVIHNEKDPFYNHEFHFSMGVENLSECCLAVSVLLKSRLKLDTLIGRVLFGPNFYADIDNMTPWGRVVLGQKTASHWYKLYI